MLKSYLLTACRHIARNKLYAFINVFGLAIGITVCLIIYLIADYELSFDTFHPDKERIYRIVRNSYSPKHGEDYSGSIATPASFAMRNEITGFQSLAVFHNYPATVTIQSAGKPVQKFGNPWHETKPSDIVIAEPQFFSVFHYDWLAGNAAVALKVPFTVVLTESKARQYFGNLSWPDMLGRTIIYNDSLSVTVTGIVKDLPANTDLIFKDFISFNTVYHSFLNNRSSFDDFVGYQTNEQVFVKLAEDITPAQVNAQMGSFVKRHLQIKAGERTTFLLQPLSGLHFNANYNDNYSRKVSLPGLYGLMAIALFILIIAVVNFITLATAQSVQRAKETGIRKICGSSQTGLITRFLGETFILTFLSVLLAVLFIQPALTAFHFILPDGVSFSFFSWQTWLFLLIVAVCTAILAGIYPAKVLASAAPVICLKGAGMQKGNRHGILTRGLTVFQFTISLVFIIGSLIINKQIQFLLNKDLGFSKDAVITIRTDEANADKRYLFAEKIRQLSDVAMVSVSEGTPVATEHWNNPLFYKGAQEKSAACILEWGDEYFVPLFNIPIIAGRNVQPSDTIKEFLINESCVRALGFASPSAAIGKYVETILPPGGMVKFPIAGVMKDFHSQSLHEPVKPVFFAHSKMFTQSVNIKFSTAGKGMGHLRQTLAAIENTWKKIYPDDTFNYRFFDNTIAAFYEKEERLSKLLRYAMVLTISISCIGLFGLSALTMRQRTKEIGIRKVLGAGFGNIVLLLGKDTIRLILIAVCIASPIAWYGMQQWLNGFAFRINISGWIFLLAGAFAVCIALFTISYHAIRAAVTNAVDSIRTE